jgi:isopenicillin N synthase-like dioxygenase
VLPSTAEARYSAIFFLYPDLEATVAPARTTVGPDRPARYQARPFADIYAEFVGRHLAYTEEPAPQT